MEVSKPGLVLEKRLGHWLSSTRGVLRVIHKLHNPKAWFFEPKQVCVFEVYVVLNSGGGGAEVGSLTSQKGVPNFETHLIGPTFLTKRGVQPNSPMCNPWLEGAKGKRMVLLNLRIDPFLGCEGKLKEKRPLEGVPNFDNHHKHPCFTIQSGQMKAIDREFGWRLCLRRLCVISQLGEVFGLSQWKVSQPFKPLVHPKERMHE